MRTKQILLNAMVITALLLSACSAFPLTRLGESASTASASSSQNTAPATVPQLPASVSASEESLVAQQGTLEEIYTRVNPSVVNVQVTVQMTREEFQFPGFNGDIPLDPQGNLPQQQGLGSGFVLDREGHIITNNHVVDGATQVTVTFSDGSSYPAKVIGKDPDADLAVIQVEAPAELLKPVTLADSDQLRVGQMAIAIGNPFGLEGTMTVGIISALGRSLPVDTQSDGGANYTIPDVIQTDAPINPGNSGGVLLNDRGEVIGVTSAIESTSGNNAGIGFAIPVDIVQRIVPELIKNGSYQHPWLGISGVTLSSAMAKAMDLPENQRGILVGTVTPGSPAEKAGLQGSKKQAQIDGMEANVGGDVIVAVDGQTIKRFDDLVSYLFANASVGQTIKLEVLRDGKQKTLEVTLAARPKSSEQASTESKPSTPRQATGKAWLGIYGLDVNEAIAKEMNLDAQQKGVLVEEVIPGSPAESAGLRGSNKSVTLDNQTVQVGGDVITAFNGKAVSNMLELKTAIANSKPGNEVELTILRDGKTLTIPVTLTEAPEN